MELSDYRTQIDRIDAELLQLFAERMQTAAGIAAYKKEHALPVLDTGRERASIAEVSAACGFDSPSYFSKQFRRFYQRPPREYRTDGQ